MKGEVTCSPLDGLLIVTFEDVDELFDPLATVIAAEVVQTPPLAFHTFTYTVWAPADVET